jgi:phospholipid/cholesterol/gamma-HCH transport system ATP-binding protein
MLLERSRMGYLFQVHALIHNYPIFDNLALPLRRHFELSDSEIRARVSGLLERFGLASISAMLPDMLSYGQKRCAALARALVVEPDVLFLDEPTSALDPVTTRLIVDMLREYRAQKRATYVIISHNAFLIRELQCAVKVLHQGAVMDLGDWVTTATAPVPEIASFLHGALWYDRRKDLGQNG